MSKSKKNLLKPKLIKNYINNIAKSMNFDITQDGIQTLIKTSNGDLRKVLNTMQVTHMAFENMDTVKISSCICYPLPQDIERIHQILITENLKNSYNLISSIIKENGFTLLDIIHEIFDKYMESYLSDNKQTSHIDIINFISLLRNIEANLTMCQMEDIQLSGFISAFHICYVA